MSADPQLTSGIQTDELDPNIRPQDDLFRHVNGKWIERTEIPSDKARYGSFYVLAEEAEKAVRDIIEEAQSAPEGTEERKFGDLYASFQGVDRIEQLGSEPLKPLLAQVNAIGSIGELLSTLGSLERQGTSGLFQLFVDNDPGNPERYLVFLEQGGIGLPDESYFRDEKFAGIREKYREFIEHMFTLAGVDGAADAAARVFDLETAIAAQHWDNVRTRDAEATYTLRPWAALDAQHLPIWLAAMDPPAGSFDELVVREPSFVDGVLGLLTDDRLDAWRDWLRWQVIRSSAPY